MIISNIYKNIENSPLILFRILFGFLVAAESFGAILTGWVKRVFIETHFTFTFIGFEWLEILHGDIMYLYFIIMGLCGILIMLGAKYRFAIISFTFLWAGVYLAQKTAYNNHYYLLLVISFYMCFLPANKYKSFDAKWNPKIKSEVMPYWVSLLFIIQISIVYFFAAIAKFYPDWLDGTFTKNLLLGSTDIEFIKNIFSKKWFYLFIAYSGILFDLLIVPFLLFKRTRTIAFIASFIFHIFNAIVLQIGIFPFFALGFILFFYEPEAIRRLFFKKKKPVFIESFDKSHKSIVQYILIPFLIIQLLLPLRHHFIKGDVLITEEGHRLSWRMMLRQKSGYIQFKILDIDTKKTTSYYYNKNLSYKQVNALATKPDFIWQYCQRIKKEYEGKNISIFIDCKNSINRKPYRTLIDPKLDFAKAKWNYFSHNDWVLID
ncbi:HTTM domain-containing protein [uncultured Flavobacterium sp.]|uniref:HTTM domain-containing protein n=1 Tax=uncultured Flavobacterium sp. TaxID=165435 RepID=UPI0030C7BE82